MLRKIEQIPDAKVDSLVKGVTNIYAKDTSGISYIFYEKDPMNKVTNPSNTHQ